MKRFEIKWFGDFECLCGDCPYTCCRGWVIPLEERDIARFRKERGFLGLRLFFETHGFMSEKFNKGSGKCTFCGRDGLCKLQKKKGHEFIPWTCQSYPRFYRNFGRFEECCLDLSCPEAARLMIANSGSCEMIEYEADPVTRPCATNDDEEFFDYLLAQRVKLLEVTKEHFVSDPAGVCEALFAFSIKLQDHFLTGGSSTCDLSFDSFYPAFDNDKGTFSPCFPLSTEALSDILSSRLNHRRLKSVNPGLYRMFCKASQALLIYERDKTTPWSLRVDGFFSEHPRVLSILGAYLTYYLFQYFLRTYETYSFRRQIALGLCHLSMILLLVMTGDGAGTCTDDFIAQIISVYNRRAYFNDQILDDMYRIFESHHRELTNTNIRSII